MKEDTVNESVVAVVVRMEKFMESRYKSGFEREKKLLFLSSNVFKKSLETAKIRISRKHNRIK